MYLSEKQGRNLPVSPVSCVQVIVSSFFVKCLQFQLLQQLPAPELADQSQPISSTNRSFKRLRCFVQWLNSVLFSISRVLSIMSCTSRGACPVAVVVHKSVPWLILPVNIHVILATDHRNHRPDHYTGCIRLWKHTHTITFPLVGPQALDVSNRENRFDRRRTHQTQHSPINASSPYSQEQHQE